MLINISDSQFIAPLLQRKSLSPEQLYLSSGQRFNAQSRTGQGPLIALETELNYSTLLYLQARDLFDELACCYVVLSKALAAKCRFRDCIAQQRHCKMSAVGISAIQRLRNMQEYRVCSGSM